MTSSLSDLYTAFDSDPTPIVGFLQALAEEYGLSQPLRALDVGCGPGRLLRPLERLRWEVRGMEPNADFLAAARSAAGQSRRVSVRAGGFLDLDDTGAFDLVLGINSSFAHLLTPTDREEALERTHAALAPGGVLCLDLPNFPWILSHYRAPGPHTSTVHGRAVTLHRRHEIDAHDATFTTTDVYVFDGDAAASVELVHVYGMVTFPELQHQLHRAGFVDVRSFNGFGSRTTERLSGPRILVSARRRP